MLLTLRYRLTTYLENALLCKQSPQSWMAGLSCESTWSCSKTALLNLLPSSLEVNTGCPVPASMEGRCAKAASGGLLRIQKKPMLHFLTDCFQN